MSPQSTNSLDNLIRRGTNSASHINEPRNLCYGNGIVKAGLSDAQLWQLYQSYIGKSIKIHKSMEGAVFTYNDGYHVFKEEYRHGNLVNWYAKQTPCKHGAHLNEVFKDYIREKLSEAEH